MPKFDKDSACAKCRATGASVEYHPAAKGAIARRFSMGPTSHAPHLRPVSLPVVRGTAGLTGRHTGPVASAGHILDCELTFGTVGPVIGSTTTVAASNGLSSDIVTGCF